MYANAADLTYATVWDLYSQLWRVVSNRFADVQVTDVTLTASLDGAYRAFGLGKVQRFKDGHWTTLKPGGTIKARSGGTLLLRAWLAPRPGSNSVGKWVSFKVPVGSYAAKRTGELTVSGGASTSANGAKPQTLAQLLSALGSEPTNNSVWGRLKVGTPDGARRHQGHAATPTVVSGSKSVTVKLTR